MMRHVATVHRIVDGRIAAAGDRKARVKRHMIQHSATPTPKKMAVKAEGSPSPSMDWKRCFLCAKELKSRGALRLVYGVDASERGGNISN